MGPGEFFGEEGLAYKRPRNAHVVAVESVTCLVFAPGQPTAFAGRGADAALDLDAVVASGEEAIPAGATTCIDVRDYLGQKLAAVAGRGGALASPRAGRPGAPGRCSRAGRGRERS